MEKREFRLKLIAVVCLEGVAKNMSSNLGIARAMATTKVRPIAKGVVLAVLQRSRVSHAYNNRVRIVKLIQTFILLAVLAKPMWR